MKTHSRYAFVLLAGLAAPVHAEVFVQSWEILADPTPGSVFSDRAPGPDGYYTTADDVAIPGLNPRGTSSYAAFDFSPQAFSTGTGNWTQRFDTASGEFEYLSLHSDDQFNCPAAVCGVESVNAAFTGTLATLPGPAPAASVNAGSLIAAQTYGFEFDSFESDGTTYRSSGTSYVLEPGQDPASAFSGDIATIFTNLLAQYPLLGTTYVAFSDMDFVGILGPSAGLTGRQTQFAFLTSVTAVPLPASLPLLGAALGLLGWRRRRA
ncbi:MAG: hypothetical protein KDK06_18030 [Gammaproteobacteria bacterium]|nr:hypothetical protein [Gammaproteobacteria bacterium]